MLDWLASLDLFYWIIGGIILASLKLKPAVETVECEEVKRGDSETPDS